VVGAQRAGLSPVHVDPLGLCLAPITPTHRPWPASPPTSSRNSFYGRGSASGPRLSEVLGRIRRGRRVEEPWVSEIGVVDSDVSDSARIDLRHVDDFC
jgi:hypothetical protein